MTKTLGDLTLQKLRNHMVLQDDERNYPQKKKWIEYDLASPSITLGIYGYLMANAQNEVADLLDEMITPIELRKFPPQLHPMHPN